MGTNVHFLFRSFLLATFAASFSLACFSQTVPAQDVPATAGPSAEATPPPTDPVADPKAIVAVGHARFTVLTPQLIRMEWSADGKFQDHASLVFINRRLPVAKFDRTVSDNGKALTISTAAISLHYSLEGDGHFTADNLSINLTVDGKPVTWHPGLEDPENLQGTTRTLDGALGSNTKEPIGQGLISRSGWALVDDSARPLFDSTDFRFLDGEKSPWPWVMERPADEKAGSYTDWYFFGYGHDYRKALGDFVRVAGRIPLPPRFAYLHSGAVVFVGDGRGGDALKPFWELLGRRKHKIKAVAMDMSEAYRKAVSTHLKQATIVFDHFHVVKLFNDKLSDLRRSLYHQAQDEQKKVLKGARWLLLKAPRTSTPSGTRRTVWRRP